MVEMTTGSPPRHDDNVSELSQVRRTDVHWDDRKSMLRRAVGGDRGALEAMIRSFIPDDERVISSAFLGTFGIIFRERAFFAVTDRRAVSIVVAPFRRFSYTDGLLEHVNSSGIGQPSRGRLYTMVVVVTILTAGIGLLFAPLMARWWYRKNKAGLFLHVREGPDILTFVDGKSLPVAMQVYRDFSLARDDRLATLALSAA